MPANSSRQLAGEMIGLVGPVGADGVQRAISSCASWSGDLGGAGSIFELEIVAVEIGSTRGNSSGVAESVVGISIVSVVAIEIDVAVLSIDTVFKISAMDGSISVAELMP